MSATNGHAKNYAGYPPIGVRAPAPEPTPREELRTLRTENHLRTEKIRAHRLAQVEARESRRRNLVEALALDWITPYAELLDLTRRTGDPVFSGPTTFWQRRGGRNWPIFQTEQELNLLRAPARILLATNGYAQGLVEGLTSYVLGSGCTYRVAKADRKDDLPEEVVAAAQDVVDGILEEHQWFGGEQPGLEEELFGRSIEDGEWLLCHYPQEDGSCEFRVQEPEQLTQPPGYDWREWSFGVRTDPNDTQKPLAYYLQHGEVPAEGEEYSPDEVTHFRRNVRRSMKRGLTDFAFDTYDALYLAGRLRTNIGDTAAQQAAIVAVRQHENGTQEDIQAFNDDDADFTQQEALTGRQENVKVRRRGQWEDMPKGMNYVPGPIATSQPIHLQVLDACLRGAGQRWQAPPWLMSGDLNTMNYATSLTAESPFVKTILRRQRGYCEAFRRPVWFALRHRVQVRGLRDRTGRVWQWEEIAKRLKLQVTAPSPETRDKLQEAQRASTEIPLGVQSRQNYMQEQGRDVDQVEADNQSYQDKFGGDGQQLPDQQMGGGAGAGTSGGGLTESLLESALLEHGFTGDITDKAGRKRHYVDGKQVATPAAGSDKAGSGEGKPEPHPVEADPPSAEEIARRLSGTASAAGDRQESHIELVTVHGPKGDYQRHQKVADDNDAGGGKDKAAQEKPAGEKPAAAKRPPRNDAKPPADLETAKLGEHLHPNVQIRHTSEGDWVVKGRNGQAKGVKNESLVSNIAAEIGLNVPRVHHVQMYGQDAAAVALVPGKALVRMTGDERKAALAKVPKEDLDNNALFDYLVANRDPNAGNYMIDPDGGLIAIDKELTLDHGGEGRKARYTPPAFLVDAPGSEKGAGAYQFDPKNVANMIEKGDEIVKKLEAAGKKPEARDVARRIEVLKQQAASGQPVTPASIDAAGEKHDKNSPSYRTFGERVKSFFGW